MMRSPSAWHGHGVVSACLESACVVSAARRTSRGSYSRCLAMCLIILAALGCSRKSDSPTQQQQQALDTLSARQWFDADKVAYRPPPISRDIDDPTRTQGFEAPPKATPPKAAGGGGFLSGLSEGLKVVVWVCLILVLIGLAFLLASVSVRSWGRNQRSQLRLKQIVIDPTRVVDLPFETVQVSNDPLEQARAMAAAGDYDKATIFLVAYMLLALDQAGKIVLHRGKTNRMYLFELGEHRRLRELLLPSILAFEDVFFGRHSIEAARFTKLWNGLDEFHTELTPIIQAQQQAQALADRQAAAIAPPAPPQKASTL